MGLFDFDFTFQEFFLAVLGLFIHILTKIAKLRKKNSKFSFKKWAELNSFETLVSFFMVLVLLIVLPGFLSEYWNDMTALMIGYQTDSIWKNVFGRKNKYVNSSIDNKINAPKI